MEEEEEDKKEEHVVLAVSVSYYVYAHAVEWYHSSAKDIVLQNEWEVLLRRPCSTACNTDGASYTTRLVYPTEKQRARLVRRKGPSVHTTRSDDDTRART